MSRGVAVYRAVTLVLVVAVLFLSYEGMKLRAANDHLEDQVCAATVLAPRNESNSFLSTHSASVNAIMPRLKVQSTKVLVQRQSCSAVEGAE